MADATTEAWGGIHRWGDDAHSPRPDDIPTVGEHAVCRHVNHGTSEAFVVVKYIKRGPDPASTKWFSTSTGRKRSPVRL